VSHQATARALEPDVVGRLARFFPDATPVRIPIKLSRSVVNANANVDSNIDSSVGGNDDNDLHAGDISNGNSQVRAADNVFFQDTVIQFGTPREVLFVVDHPLEFADRVLVETSDGSLHAEASVVAVQYHPEWTVVAVRFLKPVPNWIVKS
jgi:hypothetical protein